MDRRLYDLSQMYRDNDNRVSYQSARQTNDSAMCDCLNTDFCLPEPENMNGGILTMAFVDMQPLESVYETPDALRCGTLFPNINKPFYGGMK